MNSQNKEDSREAGDVSPSSPNMVTQSAPPVARTASSCNVDDFGIRLRKDKRGFGCFKTKDDGSVPKPKKARALKDASSSPPTSDTTKRNNDNTLKSRFYVTYKGIRYARSSLSLDGLSTKYRCLRYLPGGSSVPAVDAKWCSYPTARARGPGQAPYRCHGLLVVNKKTNEKEITVAHECTLEPVAESAPAGGAIDAGEFQAGAPSSANHVAEINESTSPTNGTNEPQGTTDIFTSQTPSALFKLNYKGVPYKCTFTTHGLAKYRCRRYLPGGTLVSANDARWTKNYKRAKAIGQGAPHHCPGTLSVNTETNEMIITVAHECTLSFGAQTASGEILSAAYTADHEAGSTLEHDGAPFMCSSTVDGMSRYRSLQYLSSRTSVTPPSPDQITDCNDGISDLELNSRNGTAGQMHGGYHRWPRDCSIMNPQDNRYCQYAGAVRDVPSWWLCDYSPRTPHHQYNHYRQYDAEAWRASCWWHHDYSTMIPPDQFRYYLQHFGGAEGGPCWWPADYYTMNQYDNYNQYPQYDSRAWGGSPSFPSSVTESNFPVATRATANDETNSNKSGLQISMNRTAERTPSRGSDLIHQDGPYDLDQTEELQAGGSSSFTRSIDEVEPQVAFATFYDVDEDHGINQHKPDFEFQQANNINGNSGIATLVSEVGEARASNGNSSSSPTNEATTVHQLATNIAGKTLQWELNSITHQGVPYNCSTAIKSCAIYRCLQHLPGGISPLENDVKWCCHDTAKAINPERKPYRCPGTLLVKKKINKVKIIIAHECQLTSTVESDEASITLAQAGDLQAGVSSFFVNSANQSELTNTETNGKNITVAHKGVLETAAESDDDKEMGANVKSRCFRYQGVPYKRSSTSRYRCCRYLPGGAAVNAKDAEWTEYNTAKARTSIGMGLPYNCPGVLIVNQETNEYTVTVENECTFQSGVESLADTGEAATSLTEATGELQIISREDVVKCAREQSSESNNAYKCKPPSPKESIAVNTSPPPHPTATATEIKSKSKNRIITKRKERDFSTMIDRRQDGVGKPISLDLYSRKKPPLKPTIYNGIVNQRNRRKKPCSLYNQMPCELAPKNSSCSGERSVSSDSESSFPGTRAEDQKKYSPTDDLFCNNNTCTGEFDDNNASAFDAPGDGNDANPVPYSISYLQDLIDQLTNALNNRKDTIRCLKTENMELRKQNAQFCEKVRLLEQKGTIDHHDSSDNLLDDSKS